MDKKLHINKLRVLSQKKKAKFVRILGYKG